MKGDALHIDLEGVRKQFEDAFGQALGLSINVAFLTPESTGSILRNAHRNALSLALNTSYIVTETIVPLCWEKLTLTCCIFQM